LNTLELGTLDQVVQVRDVGVVVLAVVELEGFLRDVRLKRVGRVRQRREGVFHRRVLVGGIGGRGGRTAAGAPGHPARNPRF